MSTTSSTPSPLRPWPMRSLRNRKRPRRAAASVLALTLAWASVFAPMQAQAQQVVYDPRNHLENALQAARQLESLTNEARALANQARSLASSPYSHLAQTHDALQDMSELARTVRGVASDVGQLEAQFASLYPDDLSALDPRELARQGASRNLAARRTAEDVARTAAELERLSRSRGARLQGALAASQGATGETAAIQSSTQTLAVLAEDLAAMRTVLLAQARLMAQETAREAAERDAAAETRRRYWSRPAGSPPPPRFDPLSRARN